MMKMHKEGLKQEKAALEVERLALDVAQSKLWLRRDRERFEAERDRPSGPSYGKIPGEKEVDAPGMGPVMEGSCCL